MGKVMLPSDKSIAAVADQGWRVSTSVRRSGIPGAGNGRYAAEEVKKGACVQIKPLVQMSSVSTLASVPDSATISFTTVEELERYVKLAADEGDHSREKVLDLFENFVWSLDGARACLNNSTWTMNHGDSEANGLNVKFEYTTGADGKEVVMGTALVDIKVGDELFNNYREFDMPPFYTKYCSDNSIEDVKTLVLRAVDGA